MSQDESHQTRVDDILEKAGPFKPFQIIILLLNCCVHIVLFYHNLLSVFTGYDPSWKCTGNSTSEFCKLNSNRSIEVDDVKYQQRCRLRRSEWSYTTARTYSFVTEFDLVCDKTYVAAVIGGSYYIGCVIGCFVSGIIADRFGRKPIILIMSLITTFSSIASSFVSQEWQLIILSLFRGSGVYAACVTSMLFQTEIAPPRFRQLFTNSLYFAESLSFFYIDLLAYFIPQWRKMMTYAALPGIPLIVLLLVLPESPRWLLVKGRDEQAKKILKRVCKIDCKTVKTTNQSNVCSNKDYKLTVLLRNRTVLKLTLSISAIWFFAAIVYYICAMESSNLGGNMYESFALSLIPDIISCISSTALCNWAGRKKLAIVSFLFSGIFLGPLALIPKSMSFRYTVNLIFMIMAKYAVSTTFTVLFCWTPELFPTVIRSRGFLICAVTDRIGVITVPFIVRLLQNINHVLPYIIGCCIAIIGSLVGLVLPETKGKAMKETYEDFFRTTPTNIGYTNRVAEEGNMEIEEHVNEV